MTRDGADQKYQNEGSAGTFITTIVLLIALSTPALGQQQPSEEELAKQTQNPVADLISVPLQTNFNFGAGFHHNKMIYILNFQPVIPINLSEEWNLIARISCRSSTSPTCLPQSVAQYRAQPAPDWATSIRLFS